MSTDDSWRSRTVPRSPFLFLSSLQCGAFWVPERSTRVCCAYRTWGWSQDHPLTRAFNLLRNTFHRSFVHPRSGSRPVFRSRLDATSGERSVLVIHCISYIRIPLLGWVNIRIALWRCYILKRGISTDRDQDTCVEQEANE